MKLKVKKLFSWAHRGVDVEEFQVGQTIETEDADLIRVATDEGWVVKVRESSSDSQNSPDKPADQDAGQNKLQPSSAKPEETQAHTSAPELK
jgi:hypothetical protein